MRHGFLIFLLLSALAVAGQESERVMRRWCATASFDINIPTTDLSRDESDDVYLEYGGSAGAALRFSWPRGWFVEPGANVGYDYVSLDPVDLSDPRVGLGRWRLAVPVTGGYIFQIDDDFGIGPLLGVEVIYNFATHTTGLAAGIKYKSSQLWQPLNFAFSAGIEINLGNMAVDTQAFIGMIPYEKGNHGIIYRQAGITAQVAVTAKYFF